MPYRKTPPAVGRDRSCAATGPWRRALVHCLWGVSAAWLGSSALPAWAQDFATVQVDAARASGLDAALEQQVRALALGRAAELVPTGATAGPASPAAPVTPRLVLVLGQLDPRLRLAPCGHVEPYLPEGTRAWGKTRIGLRCTVGAVKWNVYLPVTVKAFGAGWVANANLDTGSVLSAADLSAAEIDLADDASAAVTNAEAAVGRVLARTVKAGASLRQSHIKPRQWFGAGDLVTVVTQGSGFSVAGQATALTPGIEGQPARVRTEAGRILTGQPVSERRIELAL